MSPKPYVFGADAQQQVNGGPNFEYIRSDEPPVQLKVQNLPQRRNQTQLEKLKAVFENNNVNGMPNFTELTLIEPLLAWAYHRCIIQPWSPSTSTGTSRSAEASTPQDEPGRPKVSLAATTASASPGSRATPRTITPGEELEKIEQQRGQPASQTTTPESAASTTTPDNSPTPEGKDHQALILFNVLVALEWTPTDAYLRLLRWAFRRASDYLYDATNGCMAFGHVSFAGPEFKDACDIQIMASNRFHPRSWVAGMHESNKYLPIRMGRGTWHPGNRVCIPWNEPESYRPLVHEWGHYALGLKDEYLEERPVYLANQSVAGVYPQTLVAERVPETNPQTPVVQPVYKLAVPMTSLASRSIMAITVGTSELPVQPPGNRSAQQKSLWSKIKGYFPDLQQPQMPDPSLVEGPHRMPLPLPTFRSLFAPDPARQPLQQPLQLPPLRPEPGMPGLALPATVALDRCWLYVVRGLDTDSPALIAQGTLDARSECEPFELLGATATDQVVLEAGGYLETRVWSAPISKGQNVSWTPLHPPQTQIIVHPRPDLLDQELHRQARVQVEISATEQPHRVWLFPLGQSAPFRLDPAGGSLWEATGATTTLDGYVMLRWEDNRLMIVSFSQGGGPPSNGGFAPVPITAGSSDGNVMIFFHEPQATPQTEAVDEKRSHVKVITTINNGASGAPPAADAVSHSYPFSLSSNLALPDDCLPTLVVRYDGLSEREMLGGQLLICRLEDGRWVPQPTYMPVGGHFVAMPLLAELGSNLLRTQGGAECYQVFWLPRPPA